MTKKIQNQEVNIRNVDLNHLKKIIGTTVRREIDPKVQNVKKQIKELEDYIQKIIAEGDQKILEQCQKLDENFHKLAKDDLNESEKKLIESE